MLQPQVSLLVPIYNVERYLRECLDSARDQTLRDIEIVCINDGSTDSSPDIIREYMEQDPRFRMIDKANSGYGISMNMGIEAATGKYVGILESDDFFEPDALEKLYNAAEQFDAQVAKANFWFYWSTPEERNELFELVKPEMAGRAVYPTEEQDIFYLKPSIWSAIYRRDFLNENGIRFLETPGASYQDAGFNFKVWALAPTATFLTDGVLHYRQDNEQSSVNNPGKVYCVCDEYAGMDRFLEEHPEKAGLKVVEGRMKYDSYMWNYERLSSELRAEFLERFAEEFRRDIAAGNFALEELDWWKQPDLAMIMADPALYHEKREAGESEGLVRRMSRYRKAGGMGLVFKVLKRRVGK